VPNIKLKENQSPAQACVIWMHGLGADASDMEGLAAQLPISKLPLRHVFLDAPIRPVTLNAGMRMRAWYDVVGFKITDREDKQGIVQSQTQILEVINSQLDAGFSPNQIVLAGFSQGGAMALYTALHCSLPLAGVISLSSYLPMASECKPVLRKDAPIFLGFGQFDPLILPEWTKKSEHWLATTGYKQVSLRQYPMEHAICGEEINDIASWLLIHLRGVEAI